MLSWPRQQVACRIVFPVSCCAWRDWEKQPLGVAFGLQISCQVQKYFAEVIATHSTTEQNRKKLMLFITGSLHCLLVWEVTWCLKPCWVISLGREEDLSMSLTFLQFYSFQEKKRWKDILFPWGKSRTIYFPCWHFSNLPVSFCLTSGITSWGFSKTGY